MASELDSREDVYRNYHSSLMMYKGEPGMCRCHSENLDKNWDGKTIQFSHLPLSVKKLEYVDYRHKEFVDDFPRLGYINGLKSAFYISRKPVQRTRSGIYGEGLTFSNACSDEKVYTEDIPFSEEFYKCLKNDYPPMLYCVSQVSNELVGGSAFDKDFAVKSIGRDLSGLFYKDNLFATLTKGAREARMTRQSGESIIRHAYNRLGFNKEITLL